ncbi:MAG: hypothetical protein JXR76_22015 [Deltaproteobacteria bacterium]|nr:hypothetical protein [Deltaproteobacteria bacterium]
MGRNQRLYEQLDELEDEYLRLITGQFKQMAAGKSALYLSNLMNTWGRYGGEEADVIERVDYKIRTLQEKLGVSDADSALSIAGTYVQICSADTFHWESEQPLAKIILAKLSSGATRLSPGDIDTAHLCPPKQKERPRDIQRGAAYPKPKKNRRFPVTLNEIYEFVKTSKLIGYRGRKLLVEFANPNSYENPNSKSRSGVVLFTLYPRDYMVSYSVPEGMNKELLNAGIKAALIALKEINETHVETSSGKVEEYNFVFEENELAVYLLDYLYKPTKYRSGNKFWRSCKPKVGKTNEKLISRISLGA